LADGLQAVLSAGAAAQTCRRWRAAQEKALGLEQTETLPELSEADVLEIKRRTVRRGDSA
jgi:hypothetical protein